MDSKRIYLLIGAKGSGKSFIGTLIDKHFGIRFVRVEDWVKTLKRNDSLIDDNYLEQVFRTIEAGIRSELLTSDQLVFESTGLTQYFDQMLKSLQGDFQIVTIGVQADLETCLKRVKKRDQSIHIDFSDKEVNEINLAVLNANRQTDFEIDNRDMTETDLLSAFQAILNKQS